ncbi:NADH-ubiquinone oxidoreductase subunit NDUFA12 family protein [Pelagibacteraceae bacterium]|jgi:NADH:ubiquinone oxidoreductase subunit|nr:NADH-ubiquinone oxidoreductase subunit NDUFA12 family protein [Pelagibacteraceae bacterium]MDC0339654.1 NADH-ubiquinone oxidoreductase subunit NDUFA12 family protein [Pelagibacteraceae bacterium]|tara:strand:- start:1572 stop:1925 length:354 start_codon:yes stop_codon:yes gene_type:complete
MNLNIIFTWWNRQTFGTFLKTLFFGIFVGKDELGNKYYKNKKNERWVIYSADIEATKITSSWFMWIHHTIDKIPNNNERKYLWQKEHLENKTGTKESYRPTKIKKDDKIKKYETWKY